MQSSGKIGELVSSDSSNPKLLLGVYKLECNGENASDFTIEWSAFILVGISTLGEKVRSRDELGEAANLLLRKGERYDVDVIEDFFSLEVDAGDDIVPEGFDVLELLKGEVVDDASNVDCVLNLFEFIANGESDTDEHFILEMDVFASATTEIISFSVAFRKVQTLWNPSALW